MSIVFPIMLTLFPISHPHISVFHFHHYFNTFPPLCLSLDASSCLSHFTRQSSIPSCHISVPLSSGLLCPSPCVYYLDWSARISCVSMPHLPIPQLSPGYLWGSRSQDTELSLDGSCHVIIYKTCMWTLFAECSPLWTSKTTFKDFEKKKSSL